MRTKVEKRRGRHDPPSALLAHTEASHSASAPPEEDGNADASPPVVLSSTSYHGNAGDRNELPRDADRRPVSISEAERLAAANHVVVALGPPVIVGPSRVMFDGKGDAAGGMITGGIRHAHTGGMNKPVDSVPMLPANSRLVPEEKAIKKPPKKRRNNEKKVEVALDLSATSTLHMSSAAELNPAPVETMMINASVPAQLQQPPITPPTPSPQHQLTPPSPQHISLHNSTLLCRSPPNPVPLLQQTPPSSSEPVMMDTSADHMEILDNNNVSDVQPSLDQGSSVAQFVLSDSEAAPVPGSDMVLPSSQNLSSQVPVLMQPEAIQTLDAGDGEISSATSTSLLQPPTWLLTPQENPPQGEGSAYESMAASEMSTPEIAPSCSAPEVSVAPQESPAPLKKTSKKGTKKAAAKSISAKKKSEAKVVGKTESEKVEERGKTDGAVISDSANVHTTSCTNNIANACIETEDTGLKRSEDAEPKPKAKKPPKKRSLVDDENSAQRLAKIEETINCVIARYVYDCDDISKLDKLREAAREAEAKAGADKTKDSGSTQNADSSASLMEVTTEESQPSANLSVETTPQSSKPKRKPAAKKKKPETPAKSSSNETTTAATGAETAESEGKAPKKKPKKSKKKKADETGKADSNSKEENTTETEMAEAHSESTTKEREQNVTVKPETEPTEAHSESTTKTEETSKPSPPKKKKKPSKKKGASTAEVSESQPVSEPLPNGHIETSPTAETPKPAKKKKSKPKGKKESSGDVQTANNSSVQNSTGASETMDTAGDGVAQTTQTDEKAAEKSPTKPKPKPKKAKKRKSDNQDESESAGKKTEDSENKDNADAEGKSEGETAKPPPKKKKKKETKEGEPAEPKKKKSPSKSKKAKQSERDSDKPKTAEGTSQQNGLPVSQEGGEGTQDIKSEENGDIKSLESGESKSTEEASTTTEEGSENKTTPAVEKKVKKTLDEVICPDCGHKTRGQAALSRHMKKMHEKSVVLPYPCPKQPDCEYSASKVSLLARHMLTHSLYMCSRCQFTVDAKDKYEEHLQSEHNVKLDCKLCKKCNRYVKCDTIPMEKHLEVCQGPVPFTCDVCGKQFKYESSLKVHHHTHFPDEPKLFHCEKCEYSSNYRANLHKHIQNMHMQRPKDIKCLTCDKLFSTEDNMRRHMKIHTQVRPFKCEKCAKAFKSQCALRGHLVIHEVARPYKCNIDNCQREFRTPKFLKSHQEEFHRLIPKKYHCSYIGCTFSFFKLSHLKRHEISHTGERNFHCDHPGCGKSFRHSDNLKVHLRQHTNERPISCPHCKFTCRQKSSLQWHLKKVHDLSLPLSGSENSSNDENVGGIEVKLPEGFQLPEGVKLPEGVELLPMTEGVEVVAFESANVIIPAIEGEELPVTITELRPVDLYDFHSDNDSSDEATPGVFKRDKTKMASAAPLPPPPKELLLKNSVLDVLGEEEGKAESAEKSVKPKKKKSPSKKAAKSKETAAKEGEEGEKKENKNENEAGKEENEGKKKKKKASPAKKASPEAKKKTSSSKSKKKKADKEEKVEQKEKEPEKDDQKEDQKNDEKDDQNKDESQAENKEETAAETKSPSTTKKSPAKKKTPTKQAAKETGGTVAVKDKPVKAKAPAKGKKSPKTRASPKKPSSPKGKLAKPATRKTPPRKAAAAKKGGKAAAKKAPAKKGAAKKKTTAKKKAPLKKKAAKKVKDKQEESVEDSEDKEESKAQTPAPAPEPKPKEKNTVLVRTQVTRRSRETRNSAAAIDDASSPIRPSSPMESEEENMPQGAGSPYREFDSQDMDDSSPEPRDSPSPPASPAHVEESQLPSPVPELEDTGKEEEDDVLPQTAEIQEDTEHHDETLSSDAEDIINDIPLTPPRAPAPPPQESSDEEEMIPSPPTQMPMSADTSDTAAPSSVLTEQPGSQAPEFQQPHSREEFQQPHSHQDFQQPHSREEFQQPLSQQPQSVDYPQHHSREEIMQPHSREEYPQHHSREEYPQQHSREEYPQHHSREEYPQHHSREEYPQHHSREEYPQHHSREEYPQHHSREEYPQHHSREEYPQPHSREEYPQHHSREEYPQHHSREEYPQHHSREELLQQHSREELQPQGSVPEPMSEPVPSVRSEGLPEDVAMSHSVVQYDPATAQTVPTSEAESAYQYLQGLAQSGETISEPLAGEPSRLQQLEALAEKPHEDSRSGPDIAKSPVGAAPTSVITSLSPSAVNLVIGASEASSHRRMEILATDRQVDPALLRDTPSALPRLPEGAYDAYSSLNTLAASTARDNSNLFPAPPSTPSFMRLTEGESMLQRQRMTTQFLPTAQPSERSLSRLPESSLQPPNPSALLRQQAMTDGMFPGAPGMPQTMPRNPFTNTWATQDVRPPHWGQAPTYLQRSTNAPTTPFPFATKDNYLASREFMFDPTVRPSVTDRNMFASLSTTQSQRDLASEPSPFQLDRFDLSTYFGSHPYSGASGLDYSRTACGTTPKTFDERYRQTAASMSEFRSLPPTTSTNMFSGIGVGVNSLNSAGFNLDKYAMYGRDPMYHAAAQQLSDNTNSAFLTHAAPTQHSMFDRDYPHRSLYPHQNPAYPLFNDRQYPTAAKLTAHPTPAAMSQERDFMARPTANENQMQDPYRCGMLYNVMNRYTFE